MKKSHEVIGLPIISIQEGVELGRVKNFIINPEGRSIEFLMVEREGWQLSVKAIPFKMVQGIGEFAVTIMKSADIIDLGQIPVANELLARNIHIIGTKILTRKGHLIGAVTEYFFDEDNGVIHGVMFLPKNEKITQVLDDQGVITYGKEILVVKDDAEKFVRAHIIAEQVLDVAITHTPVLVEQSAKVENKKSEKKINPTKKIESELAIPAIPAEIITEQAAPVEEVPQKIEDEMIEDKTTEAEELQEIVNSSEVEVVAVEDKESKEIENKSLIASFEDRQRPFLLGKTVTGDIFDANGHKIAAKGDLVTDEIFDLAKSNGSSKLIELTIKVSG